MGRGHAAAGGGGNFVQSRVLMMFALLWAGVGLLPSSPLLSINASRLSIVLPTYACVC